MLMEARCVTRGEDPGHLPRNTPPCQLMPRYGDGVQMSNVTHHNGYGSSTNAVPTLLTHYFAARYGELA